MGKKYKKIKSLVQGLGIDAFGDQVIDPSKNVETTMGADRLRADDLRIAEQKLRDYQILSLKELVAIETNHAKENFKMHDDHSKDLRVAEAARLNSRREVDQVNAANNASSLALAIQTLNVTTTTNADNLRNALNSTAATMAKTTTDLAQTIATQQSIRDENINKRITSLEQSSYVGQGKDKVTDPIMEKLILKMDTVIDNLSEGKGTSKGRGEMYGWIFGGAVIFISVLKFLFTFFVK